MRRLFIVMIVVGIGWLLRPSPSQLPSALLLGEPVSSLGTSQGAAGPPRAAAPIDIRDAQGNPVELSSLPPELRDALQQQAAIAAAAQGVRPPGLPAPRAASGGARATAEPASSRPAAARQFDYLDHDERHTWANVNGWKVIVERRLSDGSTHTANRALAQIEQQLHFIATSLPRAVLKDLRTVPIRVHVDSGNPRLLQYHATAANLAARGRDPAHAGSLEIARAEDLLKSPPELPAQILEAFAQAYHHRALGGRHAELSAAYENARRHGFYDTPPAAASRDALLADERSYFAGLSVSYFGRNPGFPHTREQLQQHDPVGHRMIEVTWTLR